MRLFTLVPLLCASALAQSSETFEVASIKLGDPLSNGTSYNFQAGGSLKVENASLKSLIHYAYDIRDFQLMGAIGWIASERFNILAKAGRTEGPAEYRNMNDAQRKAMSALVRKRLQALLAERFQLAIHHETKELPVYALVIAKNGVKMQPSNAPGGGMSMGNAMYKAQGASVDSIAKGLASLVGRPVNNETGLSGDYDFKMEWTPDAAPTAPGGPETKQPDILGPTLFTALQEQLGLKLESRRGPVDIMVIDKAERPSDN